AVGRLSDPGWGGRLRELVAEDAPDQPAPPELREAVVAVLRDWAKGSDPWPARPVAVVMVDSGHRPELVTSLATHVATVGRLPLLGALPVAPRADHGRANSAQRVRALHDAITLPPALAAQVAELTGPVLLVDDLVDTGWTMTLAARLLRRAGAPAVLPLAVAVAA